MPRNVYRPSQASNRRFIMLAVGPLSENMAVERAEADAGGVLLHSATGAFCLRVREKRQVAYRYYNNW
jgi:hypothetical protein